MPYLIPREYNIIIIFKFIFDFIIIFFAKSAFGEVVPDGVGIGYSTSHPNHFTFHIAARKETGNVDKVRMLLEEALDKMNDLLADEKDLELRMSDVIEL